MSRQLWERTTDPVQVDGVRTTNDLARHCDLNGLVARQGVHTPTRHDVLSSVASVQNLEEYRNGRRHEGNIVHSEVWSSLPRNASAFSFVAGI